METTYQELRNMAREIVATLPRPRFCTLFKDEISRSRQLLCSDPLLLKLKKQITPLLENDFGHGMLHSELVCVDGGAIVRIELKDQVTPEEMERAMVLVQAAGLLHDIKRKEKHHAEKGARFARTLLENGDYGLTPGEITTVCDAIRAHEAFQEPKGVDHAPSLISDALYDADKFRWGPDNFTHTVWDMVIFSKMPLAEFLRRFPGGMEKLSQIRDTFRTETGKTYGPGFINLGIEAGELLVETLQEERSELFS
ncbi:MAG: HD domain-containing protein [Desulfobacteraceae bacterium]|nr:HD domain-containing protein [Desulfobacteraceae bacterium]